MAEVDMRVVIFSEEEVPHSTTRITRLDLPTYLPTYLPYLHTPYLECGALLGSTGKSKQRSAAITVRLEFLGGCNSAVNQFGGFTLSYLP
jgi:hypothetical protein